MSAYVVTHKHINALLSFANARRIGRIYPFTDSRQSFDCSHVDDLQKMAEILYAQNVRSVAYRYSETDYANMPGPCGEVGTDIVYRSVSPELSPVGVLKACDGLEYQSCETPDYTESAAYRILRAIHKRAAQFVPGYEKAEWTLD